MRKLPRIRIKKLLPRLRRRPHHRVVALVGPNEKVCRDAAGLLLGAVESGVSLLLTEDEWARSLVRGEAPDGVVSRDFEVRAASHRSKRLLRWRVLIPDRGSSPVEEPSEGDWRRDADTVVICWPRTLLGAPLERYQDELQQIFLGVAEARDRGRLKRIAVFVPCAPSDGLVHESQACLRFSGRGRLAHQLSSELDAREGRPGDPLADPGWAAFLRESVAGDPGLLRVLVPNVSRSLGAVSPVFLGRLDGNAAVGGRAVINWVATGATEERAVTPVPARSVLVPAAVAAASCLAIAALTPGPGAVPAATVDSLHVGSLPGAIEDLRNAETAARTPWVSALTGADRFRAAANSWDQALHDLEDLEADLRDARVRFADSRNRVVSQKTWFDQATGPLSEMNRTALADEFAEAVDAHIVQADSASTDLLVVQALRAAFLALRADGHRSPAFERARSALADLGAIDALWILDEVPTDSPGIPLRAAIHGLRTEVSDPIRRLLGSLETALPSFDADSLVTALESAAPGDWGASGSELPAMLGGLRTLAGSDPRTGAPALDDETVNRVRALSARVDRALRQREMTLAFSMGPGRTSFHVDVRAPAMSRYAFSTWNTEERASLVTIPVSLGDEVVIWLNDSTGQHVRTSADPLCAPLRNDAWHRARRRVRLELLEANGTLAFGDGKSVQYQILHGFPSWEAPEPEAER